MQIFDFIPANRTMNLQIPNISFEMPITDLIMELEKIDKLSYPVVLRNKLLIPALEDALAKKFVTPEFYSVLKAAVKKGDQIIQSGDLTEIFPEKTPSDWSRLIKALVQQKMLSQTHEGARKYYPVFSNNYLLRSILRILDREGFLPVNSGIDEVEETVKTL